MGLVEGILIGIYIAIAVVVFIVVGFGCILGGNESDLWKPFFYAIVWPPVLIYFIIKGLTT